VAIVLGSDGDGDREHFRSVELRKGLNTGTRADDRFTIWLCLGLSFDFREAWPTCSASEKA
jgi:hypothetical protein